MIYMLHYQILQKKKKVPTTESNVTVHSRGGKIQTFTSSFDAIVSPPILILTKLQALQTALTIGWWASLFINCLYSLIQSYIFTFHVPPTSYVHNVKKQKMPIATSVFSGRKS
jgi:hypothetical protein